ncbi:MAG: type II toxin-antitoxin system RelE/ParE family toxin [Chloroflexi bacterium]|nr:type II toxin-antitoxin system RelE/ParE family toxin [Chloroflexota bacterium]MCY3916190.1 type II toxin-antitoxin system RelE/ParE family toxin [Chloroflexota bacterium]
MPIFLTPRFRSQLKKLKKSYRKVNDDVGTLVSALEAGKRPGILLQGVGGREVYKVRLPNTSAGIGKRGGFRVEYYVGADTVSLFLIWSKTQVEDLPLELTLRVLDEEVLD